MNFFFQAFNFTAASAVYTTVMIIYVFTVQIHDLAYIHLHSPLSIGTLQTNNVTSFQRVMGLSLVVQE